MVMIRSVRRAALRCVRRPHGVYRFRHLLVFSDGAVRPSPFGWGGIGFALFTDDGRLIEAIGREGKVRIGINRTEIWAATRALGHVMTEIGPSGIVLHTDSDFLARLANYRCSPRRDDVVRDFATFQAVRRDHLWVEVVKVPRTHPKMKLPDRLSKESAALAKQRAQGKHTAPRHELLYARPPRRGYAEGHR
jgi:ribonuclease HI